MGIRRCFPKNIKGDCECSSVFDIEVNNVTAIFSGIGIVVGTLRLEGSICPTCNNKNSNFTLIFEDNDPSNGDQSFTFKPLSINVPDLFYFKWWLNSEY